MKRISGIILGALLYFSLASPANAALFFCTPLMAFPSPAAQQQYADCMKQAQLQKQATTSQAVSPTQSAQQTQQSSQLTAQQVQAIIGLLQAFGADQAVVAKVEIALRGNSILTH